MVNTVTDYKHSRRNMTLPHKNTGTTAVYRHIPISGWNVAQEPSTYFTTKQYVLNSCKKDYLKSINRSGHSSAKEFRTKRLFSVG
jgi:hypothetical protein